MPEEFDEELGTTADSLISPEDVKELEDSLTSPEAKALLKSAIEAAEKKVQEGGQKRFNVITREKYDAISKLQKKEEENRLYREKLLEVEKKGVEDKKQAVIDGKPKLEDFDDTADYTEALIEWNKKQEREYYDAKIKKIETEGVKSAEEVRAQELKNEWDRGRTDYKDFDEVALNPTLPYSPELREVVLSLKDPRHIAHYLGSHVAEINRLSGLSEREILLEIGKIQAKLTKPKPKSKDEEEVESEVAEVINPVKGNEIVSKDDNKMSIAELRKKYNW